MGLDVLVTIELDSGGKTFSISGLRGVAYYEERVLEIGSIAQELSLVPDEFRLSEIDVTFDNSDNYFSKLKADEPFLNRVLRVSLGDTEEGEAAFTDIFGR